MITPGPAGYELRGMFNSELRIPLCGYNTETILAEKVETILRRGILSTRPRDFYDVYILEKTQVYRPELFREALKATAEHRESNSVLQNTEEIISRLESSGDLKQQWARYQRQFAYAAKIEYRSLIEALKRLLND